MRILVRADGGNSIGMGHIMRTLTLAKELRKYFDVEYVCREGNEYSEGIHKVQILGFKVNILKEDNFLDNLIKLKGDILLTDSYDVDEEYFLKTKKKFNKTIYIDDIGLYSFKNVDMLINQNINADDLSYDLTSETRCLLGCQYTILRDQFMNLKPKFIKRKIKDIMITCGGADPFLLTLKILYYVKDAKYRFHVAIGPAFNEDYVSKLRSYESFNNMFFYYNADMKAVMEKCDMCISTAGTTLYELCAVGIPALSIVVAENQSKVSDKFNSLKIIKSLGWHDDINKEKILEEISLLNKNYSMRKEISQKSSRLVDGKGTLRIVEKILDMV